MYMYRLCGSAGRLGRKEGLISVLLVLLVSCSCSCHSFLTTIPSLIDFDSFTNQGIYIKSSSVFKSLYDAIIQILKVLRILGVVHALILVLNYSSSISTNSAHQTRNVLTRAGKVFEFCTTKQKQVGHGTIWKLS